MTPEKATPQGDFATPRMLEPMWGRRRLRHIGTSTPWSRIHSDALPSREPPTMPCPHGMSGAVKSREGPTSAREKTSNLIRSAVHIKPITPQGRNYAVQIHLQQPINEDLRIPEGKRYRTGWQAQQFEGGSYNCFTETIGHGKIHKAYQILLLCKSTKPVAQGKGFTVGWTDV